MAKPDSPWKALICAIALGLTATGARAQAADTPPAADLAQAPGVGRLIDWVLRSGDNNGLPFVVIDKLAAVVFVYGADGQSLGATPALLGSAHGDESVPGIGDRELSLIKPEERTTPAGRFLAAYGPALGQNTPVFWVDYETAVSLHPVVTANKREHRLERLRSASPNDNFITYGCINIAPDFYEAVVHQTFKDTRGVVYILPDTKPLDEVFPSLPSPESPTAETFSPEPQPEPQPIMIQVAAFGPPADD